MSDFFDFTERYLSADGKEYIDANCVREALGIVDEYVDILGVIKKLKKERDGLKADLELTKRVYKENRDFVDKVCEAVDIQRPYLESGYDNAVKLIAGIKKERDQLKKRANAAYGTSCGYSEYSGDKAPAFRCNVISYSWNFGPIAARSLMDEPSYPISSDSIRVELDLTPTANYKGTFDMEDLKKYIQNYGREKKLSDFEIFCKLVNNCIDELCDKYNVVQPDRRETTRERLDYIFGVLAEHRECSDKVFNKAEGFRKEKRALEDSLAELRAKIREIYRSVVDDEWDEHLSYTSALNDINEEYKRVVHNFEERTADWYKVQKELDRYRLAVGSLCNIPAEHRDDISWIENAFNNTKKDYLKWQTQADRLARLRSNICTALCLGGETSDEDILERVRKTRECHDKLARLRSNICSEFSLVPENCDGNIIGHIHMMQDGHNKLREFRDAVAEAIGMDYPTTNQVILNNVQYICKDRMDAYKMVAKLNDYITELEKAKEDLWELRRNTIEDLKSRGFCFRSEEDETLPEIYDKLLKRYDWAYGSYKEQYRLRQCWHTRWESENERANGVQKCLDKTREALRVKDISLETAKKQYEKVCNNLETAECAINGMKSKIRELQKELKEERHPNLTEDNEMHPIDTDPGYLRNGEEETDGTADTDD